MPNVHELLVATFPPAGQVRSRGRIARDAVSQQDQRLFLGSTNTESANLVRPITTHGHADNAQARAWAISAIPNTAAGN